jgi:hypothetical protein
MNELTHTIPQPLRPGPPYKTFLQELLGQKKRKTCSGNHVLESHKQKETSAKSQLSVAPLPSTSYVLYHLSSDLQIYPPGSTWITSWLLSQTTRGATKQHHLWRPKTSQPEASAHVHSSDVDVQSLNDTKFLLEGRHIGTSNTISSLKQINELASMEFDNDTKSFTSAEVSVVWTQPTQQQIHILYVVLLLANLVRYSAKACQNF